MQMPIELLPAIGLRISGQRQVSGAGSMAGTVPVCGAGSPAQVRNRAVAALSRAMRTTSGEEM